MNSSPDMICIGIALVDSIIRGFDPNPVSASGYRAESGSLNVGGEAVNESMAAAKLGVKTGILTSLGKDEAGDMIVAALQRCGVDTGLIIRSAQHPTPVTTMFVRDDGTRKSVTNSAHRYNFHPEQYAGSFSGAKALLLGSLFRAPFDDPDIIHSVLLAAKTAGQTVFADTKLPNFRKLSLDDLAGSLDLIDYITPNEDEAKYYSGKQDPEAMELPPHKIKAVDATGAGDNFLAGFASEILRGSTPQEALAFANACGAICTTAVGAATALQSREQVLKFMNG